MGGYRGGGMGQAPAQASLLGTFLGGAGGAPVPDAQSQRAVACLGITAAVLLLLCLLLVGIVFGNGGGGGGGKARDRAVSGGGSGGGGGGSEWDSGSDGGIDRWLHGGGHVEAADYKPGGLLMVRGHRARQPETLLFHIKNMTWAERTGFRYPESGAALKGVQLETTLGCSVQCSVYSRVSRDPLTVLRGSDGDVHTMAEARRGAGRHGHPVLLVSLQEDVRSGGVYVSVVLPDKHTLETASGDEPDDGEGEPTAALLRRGGGPPTDGEDFRLRGCSVVLTVVGGSLGED